MQTYNSFNELVAGQTVLRSDMSVFNATSEEREKLNGIQDTVGNIFRRHSDLIKEQSSRYNSLTGKGAKRNSVEYRAVSKIYKEEKEKYNAILRPLISELNTMYDAEKARGSEAEKDFLEEIRYLCSDALTFISVN